LLTGFSHGLTPETIREMGFRRYVMKPVIMQELAETIRNVLDETPGKDSNALIRAHRHCQAVVQPVLSLPRSRMNSFLAIPCFLRSE